MKMDGEYTLPTNVENVWNKLNDPLVLKNSIPGCTELTKENDNEFKATVTIKIGPVSAKFNGEVKLPNIKVYEGLSFTQLDKITSKSSVLISCHGAISHLAAAYNIKQIDIIDKSYNYHKWTDHFRNYKSLERVSFNDLSNRILEML